MTEKDPSQDYLWNPVAETDPEIQKLEEILKPLRSASVIPDLSFEDEVAEVGAHGKPVWGLGRLLVAAAVVAIVFTSVRLLLDSGDGKAGDGNESPEQAQRVSQSPAPELDLIVESTNQKLLPEEVIEPEVDENLVLADMGQIAINAGSRLRVQRLQKERTRLYLDYGEIRALIYLNAKPRFFEVGTPATTCVDLGCEYTLNVDEEGVAQVSVTSGQVAFVDRGKEIFVPNGATCRADKKRGAGTPRFRATPPAMAAKLDRFDSGDEALRSQLAADLLEDIAAEKDWRHTLIAWHFLQDDSPAVFNAAKSWLDQHFEKPASVRDDAERRLTAEEVEAWKGSLQANW